MLHICTGVTPLQSHAPPSFVLGSITPARFIKSKFLKLWNCFIFPKVVKRAPAHETSMSLHVNSRVIQPSPEKPNQHMQARDYKEVAHTHKCQAWQWVVWNPQMGSHQSLGPEPEKVILQFRECPAGRHPFHSLFHSVSLFHRLDEVPLCWGTIFLTPLAGSSVSLSQAPPAWDSPRVTFDHIKSVHTVARQTDP